MSKHTTDPRQTVRDFMEVSGVWRITKDHADGRHEEYLVPNVVVADGRDNLAARSIVTSYTPFGHMAAGSGSAAGSLQSTALTYETIRKAATMSTSDSVIIGVACFGGAADGITSEFLDEAGLFNDASSGQGTMMNHLTGINHTFAQSDVVKAQMEVGVGSY
ncbi:MAG TPA: hypothetical protein VKA48_12900 [Gammaproteobacteria bacterium]|nr:hypothetical protein [Gammaproteobacteria bacterium]